MGPSLAIADVITEDGDVTRWRVTYRVWDAGDYSVLVQSECDTLDFASDYLRRVRKTKSHVMAEWVLTVLPPAKPSTEPVLKPSTEPATEPSTKSVTNQATEPATELEPASTTESQPSNRSSLDATYGPDSPCDHAIHGRWLINAQKRAYEWQLYPCAHPLPPVSQWLSALQSRGISEINFVGDSHVRFLCHHLFFLLTGKANASAVKLHEYHQLVVPPPSPKLQPLTLNFYWIGGIYIDGPFGCSYKNVTSFELLTFPKISTTASVTLVDGGFWMTVFCAEPENALGYYLPNYLQWVYSQRELAMQVQRQPHQQQQQDYTDGDALATSCGRTTVTIRSQYLGPYDLHNDIYNMTFYNGCAYNVTSPLRVFQCFNFGNVWEGILDNPAPNPTQGLGASGAASFASHGGALVAGGPCESGSGVAPGDAWVLRVVPLPEDAAQRAACVRQAERMMQLRHPCLAECKAVFVHEASRSLCTVTEHCGGDTLSELIRSHEGNKSFMPEQTIVDWLLQVTLALEHMHHHNMLHRGVTAENILLCSPSDSNPARVRLGMCMAAEMTSQEPYDCKSGELTRWNLMIASQSR
ncbi:unnamed protein product [Closterium sp. NIES-53]